jgi:alanyl-tRNA synthetase
MTTKAYLQHPYQRVFNARVVSQQESNQGWEIVLDRTLFYPTSGGQPHDTGMLGNVPVVEVMEKGNDIVHHLAGGPLPSRVRGEIDWARRFDHMQQHTGQHILSQAFEQVLGAHTVAFHLGRETVTIDLDSADLTLMQAYPAEDKANQIVFQNRRVHSRFVTEEESTDLDLRKLPKRHGTLRIVEVDFFDRIPCGGTHCRMTGEVGVIKILRLERRGKETRVEFICGGRALSDYRWRNDALRQSAEALNVSAREAPDFVAKVLADRDDAQKQVNDLRDKLLRYESVALAATAKKIGEVDVVNRVLEEQKPDELKWLAQHITTNRSCLALLGSSMTDKGHLVFARSEGLSNDMGALLKFATTAVGGRGGGRPEMAQGGAPPDRLEEAIDAAIRSISGDG